MANMTRMDRHRQAELEKEQNKRKNNKSNEEPQLQNGSQPNQKKPKKIKKKKKKSKIFFLIVIALIVLSVVGYFKGVGSAKLDKNNKQADVGSFLGEKSQDGSTNVLLLGSDSRGEDQGRSDSIMIAHYDKKTNNLN
ncbi:hypothetical protein [Vagococcus carniphilus]|uniref:hypothetical protein n=1 Tax=Vagococcus carniphilus TaxID=218144 RepID=UPI003B591DB8